MTFRTLGDAMMSAIAQGMLVDGEAGVAAPALRRKGPGVASPVVTTSGELSPRKRPALRNIKREPAHDPTSEPPLGAGSRLVFRLIEGGRNPGGRDNGVPTYRSSPQERQAREFLKLVVG